MIDVRIEVEVPSLAAWDRVFLKQLPFATTLAVTRTAADARDALREELPRHFAIRTPWTAKGIRSTYATKARPYAEIGSRDPYMALQEMGGYRLPRRGGKAVSVPFAARQPKTATTPRRVWPRNLLRQKLGFLRGDVLFLRTTAGLRVAWLLRPTVKVPRRWPLAETVERIARARWEIRFREAFRQAVSKRR